MTKLGKRTKAESRTLKTYAFCVCSNCPCGPTTQYPYTTQASYVDSNKKA